MIPDLSMLPCWALVDQRAGVRIAGYAEERELGGEKFVAVTPYRRRTVSINATLINRILPCTEAQARLIADRQWVGA